MPPWRRRLAIVLIISLAARYLLWRVLFGLNQQIPHGVGLELAAAGLRRLADPDGPPADWLVVLRAEDRIAAAADGGALLQRGPSLLTPATIAAGDASTPKRAISTRRYPTAMGS